MYSFEHEKEFRSCEDLLCVIFEASLVLFGDLGVFTEDTLAGIDCFEFVSIFVVEPDPLILSRGIALGIPDMFR